MNAAAFRAALRIARRDAWRAKWRSLLVIALIGLPVLVLSLADVTWRTYQLEPEQELTRELGAADALIQPTGGSDPIWQTPQAWLDGYNYQSSDSGTAQHGPPPFSTQAEVLRLLPAGSRVIPWYPYGGDFVVKTKAGVEYVSLSGLDYADPIAEGLITQLSGRAPRAANEVAITRRLADDIHLKVGDALHEYDGGTFTVVGIVRSPGTRADSTAYALPSAVAARGGAGTPQWLIDTPGTVSWPDVQHLNTIGLVVLSREAYLHPPPDSQVPHLSELRSNSRVSGEVVATGSLIVGMALLEVVLLAGPAFAVTARRQRRDLALVATTGGRRSDLRNIVLANGVVLGVAAGVIAVVVGVAAAAIGIPLIEVDQIPGPFDLHVLDLLALVAVSLVTALLAAVFPARSAARTDVVAALAGRRGQQRIKRRVPIIGAIVTALGVVIALAGTSVGRNVNVILAGVVVVEFGLIICTPTLIMFAARLGRHLPFAARLAVRDAARNRSSAAPAVAAVMAATIGAVAVAITVASQTDLHRRQYQPSMPDDVAFVGLYQGPDQTAASADMVADLLASDLSTESTATVYSLPSCFDPTVQKPCTSTYVQFEDPNGTVRAETRWHGGVTDQVVVDDGSAVGGLFGQPVPEAVTALHDGKAVVVDSALLHDGKIDVWSYAETISHDPDAAPGEPPTPVRHTLPAIAVDTGFPSARLILPPSLARTIVPGDPRPTGVLARLATRPTAEQRQRVNGALAELQPGLSIQTEDGFHDDTAWALYALVGAAALIALGAAAVATMLANVDGRADLVTLGAVGASPRTRRVVSMSRAGVIAGLGCLVGTAAGFVPAIAWVKRSTNAVGGAYGRYTSSGPLNLPEQLRLVVPWELLALVALGIPLAAVLCAGLFSRSRLPSERRAD